MKKFGLAILLVCLMPVVALASPFLTCDPQAGVTSYEIELNGAVLATDVAAEADGSLRYDLDGIQAGALDFRARCKNATWPDWSGWSVPLSVTKPGVPAGLGVGN